MKPTIYKPSIYKGAGIYKVGAEGGGGGANFIIKDINGIEYEIKDYIKLTPVNGNAPFYTMINAGVAYNDTYIFDLELNQFSGGESYKTLLQRKANVDGYNRDFADGIGVLLNFSPYGYFRIMGTNLGNSAIGDIYQRNFKNSEITDGSLYRIVIKNGSISIDPNLSTAGSNYQPNFKNVNLSSLRLLGNNETFSGGGIFSFHFYAFIVLDNADKLKFNYRPAKRVNDGKIGFMDLVNLIFYPGTYSDDKLDYIELG